MDMLNSKVFCIGLGKTGTTTFAECMKILGFKHQTGLNRYEQFRPMRPTTFDEVKFVADENDSLEDFPWPYYYKELHTTYKDALFVLTVRKNVDLWYESLCKHYCRTRPSPAKRIFYGYYSPYENPGHHKRLYEAHNRNIRDYFSGNPRFLEVCWETGDGWKQLCGFLNYEIPHVPFPHAGQAPGGFDIVEGKRNADQQLALLRQKPNVQVQI